MEGGVNKVHLLEVKYHILAMPARLLMADWACSLQPGTAVCDNFAEGLEEMQVVPECGTVACIAGWSSKLRGQKSVSAYDEMFYLGLKSDDLFFPNRWPQRLWDQYRTAKTVRDKAFVAGLAIDAVIEGNGDFLEPRAIAE